MLSTLKMSGRYKNVTASDIWDGNPSQESDRVRPLVEAGLPSLGRDGWMMVS